MVITIIITYDENNNDNNDRNDDNNELTIMTMYNKYTTMVIVIKIDDQYYQNSFTSS